jgi:hypothetical protein
MQRFYLTAVKDKGRPYWMANYPGERPVGSRRARPRKQRMFAQRVAAEEFLEAARREYFQRGRVELAYDRELHSDVLRAVKILADMPGATLSDGALLLRECRSSRERRGGGFEEPRDRMIELHPRLYLGMLNQARNRGMRLRDLVSGVLWGWIEEENRRSKE